MPHRRLRSSLVLAGLLAVATALTAPPVPAAPSASARADVAPVGGADTRDDAIAAYRTVAKALRVPARWTGSVKGCRVGRESDASRTATLRAVNELRELAGADRVRLATGLNRKALAAALIMKAEGALSHDPPKSWRCWSRAGAAGAGASNLFLGASGAGAMVGYVDDEGVGSLGHRRWLLNPGATTFGTGSTGSSNALYVFGDSTTVPSGTAVAWPPAGHVPEPWLFADWSLEVVGDDVDAGGAQVEVSVDGDQVPVRGVTPLEQYYGPGEGVTWRVDLPASVAEGDHTVEVRVTGVRVDGVTSPIAWTTTTVDVG